MSATTIDAVLAGGERVVLREEAGLPETWARIHGTVVDAVGEVVGAAARDAVARDGLVRLHDVLPAAAIGELRDAVMPRVRTDLLDATVRVAREVLGMEGEFFVDDYTILRVNFPFEVALQAPREAENPGIGRMSAAAKRDAAAAKVVDPIYDPRGYHRDQPPASWAHGPHLDTWTGHSRDGINLWWAISDVVAESSMFFYPEVFGRPLAPDPRSLYLAAGQPLPRPTPAPLRAGEMIVFNPEILHGTHLNVSGLTRVAASTRINAHRPRFDPTCFYAREFWHSSESLERGDHDGVVRFPRADNLGPEPERPSADERGPVAGRVRLAEPLAPDAWTAVCPAGALPAGGKLVVETPDDTAVLLVSTGRGVRAVGARCPHLGTDLADGFHDDETLHCPAHALSFSLESGRSSCDILRLPVADVRIEDGSILVRPAANGAGPTV